MDEDQRTIRATSHSESTPSSMRPSSSDKIASTSKGIDTLQIEINKEIDKLFGPTLERTKSDIEVTAPLRQRKRQYRSQEVLSPDTPLNATTGSGSSETSINVLRVNDSKVADDSKLQQVAILYDNQRADIVASVTERLYNRLKRNEKVVAKMESMVDKKIMQPLNELKICSNARQRLVELGQKAVKHRRKIGIPVHTQTKKYATRVKDQAIDIQNDLQPHVNCSSLSICTLQKDVATETDPITLRYKDAAVGSQCGTLNLTDRSTLTINTMKTYKHSFTMTDITTKCDCSTQTHVMPPPRRKKRLSVLSKFLKKSETIQSRINRNAASVININISPLYSVDSESSDEQSECTNDNKIPTMNRSESIADTKYKIVGEPTSKSKNQKSENKADDFSDDDGISRLPRISVDPSRKIACEDYKEMALGSNHYPFNVILSPTKETDKSKRVIKFKDIDITPAECGSTKWFEKINRSSEISRDKKYCNNYKSAESISIDTAEIMNIKYKSVSNGILSPNHSDTIYKKIKDNMYATDLNLNNTENNNLSTQNHNMSPASGLLKYSLSDTELRSMSPYNTKYRPPVTNNFDKFISNLDSESRSLRLLDARHKLTEPSVSPTNRYLSNGKLAPTEYLKQLILIRREAVAAKYKNNALI